MIAISRTLRSRTNQMALLAVTLAGALGCGADFDTQDKVKTLRVFAVQSDYPYVAPQHDSNSPSQVQLTMLSHNGLPVAAGAEAQPVERLWFSGCDNLPGDQYFTCLARMAILWRVYSEMPGRLALQDGQSWSPADDLDDATLQSMLQQLNPTLPPELARSYFNTYRIGAGERFTYPIPPGIIENHASADPEASPFGLAFVFFTACAGHIEMAPEWKNLQLGTNLRDATLGFPFQCRSGTGANGDGTLVASGTGTLLDSDSFVGGYMQQFVYSDPTVNKNPVIDGVTFNGSTYTFNAVTGAVTTPRVVDGATVDDVVDSSIACFDGNCVPVPQRTTECAAGAPSVKACRDHCPEYEILPKMQGSANNDIDTFSSRPGSIVGEQMWIDYYADGGELDSTAKSVRDATLGWLPDTQRQNIGNKWKPPADAGPVSLWAVVHDNRSGVAWFRLQVCVIN